MPGWNWQNIKQMLSNTTGWKLLKIIHILYKIIKNILKNKQKASCLYSWYFMINHNENEDEMKSDINRPTIIHKIFETDSSFHMK